MQINNIKISKEVIRGIGGQKREIFYCISPERVILESFMLKENAIKWAKKTFDFISKKK